MADAFIQALEDLEPGLGTVPGYDGTKRDGFRIPYAAWKERVTLLRVKMFNACLTDQEMQARELAICAQDAAYWLVMYGWIDEPRPRKGEDTVKFFIPSAAQVEYIQWMQRKTEDPEPFDGYTSKSRKWGATRTVCAFGTWGWRFRGGWRGLFVSRKEDLVDRPKDLNSMFGYITFLIKHLPPWMLPEGWDERLHRLKLLIINPENDSQLSGESTTTKAGRGSRSTYVIVDEAAFVPDFIMTFGTLSGTTDHRFALSTESFEEGFEWFNTWTKYRENTDIVKELNYYDNPWFDDYTLAEEEARWEHDPAGFIREYFRDPYSGFGQAVYPIAENLPKIEFDWDEDAYLLVGIDWGRADDTAMAFAQFTGTGADRKLVWLDSYEKNLMPGEFYAHILTGIPPRPGDKCFVYWDDVVWENGRRLTFTDRDKEMMRWLRQVNPTFLRTFCDPSGANKDSGGLSWVMRLATTSKMLRQREDGPHARGIVPLYKDLFAKTDHASARSGLRGILPNTVFSHRDGAHKRLRLCFKNHRFNEPGNKATGEPTPIHDEYSHLVKGAEALANYIDLGVAEPRALERAA